jgi:catechol 2,3-dioxygenase-like lactoylglutathione lyase family enzyme
VIAYIGRTVLLVRDYDEAIGFYREKLGFEVIFDQVLESGFRAVHVGPQGQSGVGLWLMEAHGDEKLARLGNQTGGGPVMVMYTGDCRATTSELAARDVTVLKQPQEETDSVFSHVADLYGNEIVLVELRQGAGEAPESRGAEAPGRTELRVSTVFLPVTDIERSAGWYESVLGLERTADWGEYLDMRFPDAHARESGVTLFRAAAVPRFTHATFNLLTADAPGLHADLSASGVETGELRTLGKMTYFDAVDPDGHRISIIGYPGSHQRP